MTDPSRRDGWGQEHPGTYNYPAFPGSPYGQQPSQSPANDPGPTEHLPAYSPYGYDPRATGQYGVPPNPPGGMPPEPPKPGGPNPRRWLWVLAGTGLLIVLGLVIGLVIVNSAQQNTVVAPPQTPIEPTMTVPIPTTTTRTPTTPRSTTPSPTTSRAVPPPDQTDPGGTHTVVYSVAGEGRAISILYLDSGGVLQTEFNVLLPWTKEVQLTGQANSTASVSIVNVGRQLTCSITIDGTETQQNTGTGLTLCTSLGTR
ncbi:MmpS family transport accessory protein [Mycolicibacterium sp. 050158]|uniref:MmpS family transport accessory protein n=1 Tax=Mycolicibacterium sp. 050158 TaxID=3090602 RepID=UPI00299DB6DF|nr:MmpS family transport accessory protein [Mycolicibacterium sp. 050158]MDX1891481.1 MmpS family transport accessory protein [Mycolicibacterium sp. 050158]